MFRLTQQSLNHHWTTTKKVFGDAWNGAMRFGQQLDHGMRIGKRLLSSVAPILDQMGQGHHANNMVGGIKAYDQGKADVVHGINNIQTHLRRVRRQVPEIDL